ncbi:MAG: IscS subfamily cysteine desulfurase [Deltaproteobacteria bacterium]|nr:IscS subfamily cysteine desulfurase [Deltaproteobacteria bacterium]
MSFPIYLDNHATTRVDPRVLEAMLPYFTEHYGNAASRNHVFGWQAEEAVENAREQIRTLIGAKSPKEIIFTSGATESNNLAIKGVAYQYREKGNHIITVKTEHKAVLETCKRLEREGFEVSYLDVNKQGQVDPDDVRKAIRDKTILVSVMLCNNEIGTIQPIAEIGKITRERGVLFHTDAVQGLGRTFFDVEAMNVDLASFSAHKIYGPKGIGALYVRRNRPRVRLTPIIDGGGHEHGMRSGTLNVPGIVGFGKACAILKEEMHEENERLRMLRNRLREKLFSALEMIHLNGAEDPWRHPGNLHVSFSFVEGEALMMGIKEIAVSSGSACTSASLEPSHVLRALGVDPELAHSSIRFGIGRFNTLEEIDYVAEAVIREVNRLREMSPLYELYKEGIDYRTIQWISH